MANERGYAPNPGQPEVKDDDGGLVPSVLCHGPGIRRIRARANHESAWQRGQHGLTRTSNCATRVLLPPEVRADR
eukprot:2831326-Rhodomonas_salina.1